MNAASTRLLAQTPLPRVRPVTWNHSASNWSAAAPESSAIPHRSGATHRCIGASGVAFVKGLLGASGRRDDCTTRAAMARLGAMRPVVHATAAALRRFPALPNSANLPA